MADYAPFADSSPLEVGDAIAQLGCAMSAIHRQVLALVALADERGDWREDGAGDMAGWLCARLGLRSHTAAEWVRVAHALESLPECGRAYAEGRLAWDQVRPLTEFTKPEHDAEQAASAIGCSAAFLETVARRRRRIDRAVAERQHQRRSLRTWWSDDEFRLSGRFPAADGAVIETALNRIAEQGDPADPLDDRLAEAMTQLSSTRLAEDQDADRACVVVHVEAVALAGDGSAQLAGEHPIAIEVAQRLACDSRLEVVADGPTGCRWAWAGRGARFRPGCGECWSAGTAAAAGSLAATTAAGSRATTSSGGRGAAERTWTT